jgi:hypothetical protein
MRKVLLSTFSLLLCSVALMAQSPATTDISKITAPMNQVKMTGFEEIARPNVPVANNPLANGRTDQEALIGTTIYDLQTNGAVQNRLVRNADNNELAAVWTRGFSEGDGYADRGAGYNFFTDNAWGEDPTERIETVRTGWPSISMIADGSQVVIAHASDASLVVNRNAGGTWVESTIPSNVPAAVGMLWPRSVAGGPDGNTIHAMAITTPVANAGALFEGVDGHLLYHRSLDGGATWDMVDVIIPGLDNTKFNSMDADSYAIDADGENVAIALFSGFGDVMVAKSEDNGSTWTSTVIHDFPFDNYVADTGYDTLALDPQETADGPNGTAIQTSDGTGDVIIDQTGMAHVFYGEMYVQDIDLTDGNTTFFPGWFGVRYWNELHGEDSTRVVASVLDADGNGTYDLVSGDNIAAYFTSLTSFISAGVDNNNNLVIAYSALTENLTNDNASPNAQNNRHILLSASTDNGETWLDTPVDVVREDVVLEPDLFPAITAVFPSVSRNIGDNLIHLIYQQDFEPGLAIRGDEDPTGTNFISYVAVDVEEVGIVGTNTEVVDADAFSFELAPNPATDAVRVSYELPETSKVTMTVANMMGQTIRVIENSNHSAGMFSTQVDLDGLAHGVYLVTFRANDRLAVQKLIVE